MVDIRVSLYVLCNLMPWRALDFHIQAVKLIFGSCLLCSLYYLFEDKDLVNKLLAEKRRRSCIVANIL